MEPKKNHHHGNLRNALIKAALELLVEGGQEGLTLRKAAARAGVSHAAPAHHFDGIDGLQRAVAAKGFQIFARYMSDGTTKMPDDAQNQLLGITYGYLKFASDHEALFNLIFSKPMKNSKDAELQAASMESFNILSDVCALFEQDPAGPFVNEIKIWSVVHGYAVLRQFNRLKATPEGPAMPVELILPQLTPLKP